MTDLAAEIARLKAENEELRKALNAIVNDDGSGVNLYTNASKALRTRVRRVCGYCEGFGDIGMPCSSCMSEPKQPSAWTPD